eukprot:Selendium_serpulae@DN6219_c1_g1_i6.p3
MEMDIIRDRSKPDEAHKRLYSVDENDDKEAAGEMDFVGRNSQILTARQWVAAELDKGDYILRIADDHYRAQFSDDSTDGCFPLALRFSAIRVDTDQPAVIAVHPDPSRHLLYGQDLVIFLRLSVASP